MSLRPWDELQLRFELPGLDEVDEDAQERQITPEQARMISEAARVALEAQVLERQEPLQAAAVVAEGVAVPGLVQVAASS